MVGASKKGKDAEMQTDEEGESDDESVRNTEISRLIQDGERHLPTDGGMRKKLEAKEEEIRRLHVVIEEMRMKFKDLLDAGHCQGIGGQLKELAQETGIMSMLGSARSVFTKLYEDAIRRLRTFETIREMGRKKAESLCLKVYTSRYKDLIMEDGDDEDSDHQAQLSPGRKPLSRNWAKSMLCLLRNSTLVEDMRQATKRSRDGKLMRSHGIDRASRGDSSLWHPHPSLPSPFPHYNVGEQCQSSDEMCIDRKERAQNCHFPTKRFNPLRSPIFASESLGKNDSDTDRSKSPLSVRISARSVSPCSADKHRTQTTRLFSRAPELLSPAQQRSTRFFPRPTFLAASPPRRLAARRNIR